MHFQSRTAPTGRLGLNGTFRARPPARSKVSIPARNATFFHSLRCLGLNGTFWARPLTKVPRKALCIFGKRYTLKP